MLRFFAWFCLVCACGFWGLGYSSTPVEQGKCPKSKQPKILADLYHTRLQNHVDYRLKKGEYSYQGVFGYYRAFRHLQAQGYQIDVFKEKPITSVCLDGYDTLFINLLHESRPAISKEEQKAILEYVHKGGGLVIIVDHTNVYRHAERLNPMLMPMGIEILFGTMAELSPAHSIEGNGWIKVLDFRPHPITKGVKMLSLQTGTALKTKTGVAFSSKNSFSDFWNEKNKNFFHGDWKHNGDDKKEPRGPLPVVAATSYGKGRVVVLGDQNMFGDTLLHFGDNFTLFMNTFAWTSKQEQASPHPALVRPPGYNIGLDLSHGPPLFGKTTSDGYYSFFTHLNRDEEVTARALSSFVSSVDAWFSIDAESVFSSTETKEIQGLLKKGKKVVLFFEAEQVTSAMRDLIVALAPDFSMEAVGKTYAFNDPVAWKQLKATRLPQIRGTLLPVSSKILAVKGLEISSVLKTDSDPPQVSGRYLFDLRSLWGNSFLLASYRNKHIDIARMKKIDKGELIIFIQDGFWRNRTMGNRATVVPSQENKDVVTMLYAFLDYLKKPK